MTAAARQFPAPEPDAAIIGRSEVVVRLDATARQSALAAALSEIPARDRDVLPLVAWAELTSEQAGKALGIPAGTARSRLHRARQGSTRILAAGWTDDRPEIVPFN
jgi:RNA polymerase sigma factor (sigma-70 family)